MLRGSEKERKEGRARERDGREGKDERDRAKDPQPGRKGKRERKGEGRA